MKRTGPDSLNSWIIALGCCFINMMMFGMARLSGVLFVASVPRFNISREKASFPYTLSQATRNTAGPLVGYLGQKFGVRLVTSLGGVVAAVGIGTCFLAENIDTITVLWGVIFGLGFGMGNILLPISINQYFDKKRATASGISFSGACIGSFVIPPIVEFLINKYGLSGTFLILSGLVLNCLPAALLLKKPNFLIKISKENQEKYREKQSIIDGKKVKLYTVEDPSQVLRNKPDKISDKYSPCLHLPNEPRVSKSSYDNNVFSPSSINHKNISSAPLRSAYQISKPCIYKEEPKNNISNNQSNSDSSHSMSRSFSARDTEPFTKNDNSDCLYSRSYQGYYSNSGFQADSGLNFEFNQKELYERSSSFTPSITSSSTKDEKQQSDFQAFDVIFDPIFILIALTNAVYSAMFVCMITVIVDFAKDINVGETNEKYIIMSLSVGDFIGRLGLGWVTDDGYLTRSNFAALCFFCQAITTIVIPWSTGFIMLMAIAALYGLSEAGLIVIFPLIVAEFIEEKKQTVAIPTSYFLSGPLCLTVAPLIGFFRDDIGSYDLIFYGMGVISLICTCCWLLAPCIVRCRRRKR